MVIYLVVQDDLVGQKELSKSTKFNQEITKEQSEECLMLHSAWNDLTKVWTLPVIHALGLKEPARFNDLKRRIQGISATSLAERLNELAQRRIIERKVFPETPPRVEYSLTKKGIELHALLGDLAEWVKRWDKDDVAGAERVRIEKVRAVAPAK